MKTTLADKWFSLFIRIRDAHSDGYCRCITCGRIGLPKSMDCGHYVKRQHSATRFNEMNAHAQCKQCNAFEQGRDDVYRQRLIEKYGEEKVLLLEACRRTNGQLKAYQLKEIENMYREKAKALAKERGIALW